MAWIVVPNLLELRDQLNKIAPNRDKASDGTVGDYNHSKGKSSHNPDDTVGNAEWEGDPDGKEEIRAIDLDVDFKVPGLTAEKLVNHLIKYAKNGTFWWIRYIIYDRKIYHKNTGFAERSYGGSNPHDKHIHVNSDFSQRADEVSGCNYRLNELVEEDMNPEEIAKAVWEYILVNPYNNTNARAGTLLRYAPSRQPHLDTQNLIREVLNALTAIGQKVDLDASEIEAISRAITVPTAQENAEAVLEALGREDTNELVDLLRNALSVEQREALAAALLA